MEGSSALQSRLRPLQRTSHDYAIVHIAAAAKQLNRQLFNDTPLKGSVTVGHDKLEVLVHGRWSLNKVSNFAGYSIDWRELPAAA